MTVLPHAAARCAFVEIPPSQMPNHNHSNVDPRMRGLSQVDVHKLQAAARAIRDGQPAMAESELDAVLKGHPGHPEALRLKGILRNRQRRHDEAERLLLQALQQRPNDAAILSDHASALFGMGRKREAFEAWRKACKVQPDFPWAWFNLGRNLQQEGDTAAAIEALERTVRLAPGMLPAHILLGDALVHAGRFDDADARYRAALELDPACGDAWRGLSNMKTRALTDADAHGLRAALANPSAQPADRIAMGHALGKLLEDRAQFADALAAFEQANAEAAKLARWDRGCLPPPGHAAWRRPAPDFLPARHDDARGPRSDLRGRDAALGLDPGRADPGLAPRGGRCQRTDRSQRRAGRRDPAPAQAVPAVAGRGRR